MMIEEYTKHICKEVTEEIKKFVKEEVFGKSEYLFVTNEKGRKKAYCSRCNTEYETQNVHHNEAGICPVCGESLMAKFTSYGRKNCKNEACFYYFEKSIVDPQVVVCKGYYVEKDYTLDYKNPSEKYYLHALYIFENNKATMLKNSWNSGWEIRNSVFDFNQGWLAPKMCYCSFKSIGEAIKDTSYKYMPYEMFQSHYSMVKFFNEYTKYPWIEQISKVGFTSIIEAKLTGAHIYNCLNYKGKDIYEILKLSRKDIKEIKKSGEYITPLFLSLYQIQAKDKSGLSPADVMSIADSYGYNYIKLKNIFKHTTMKKAFKYMEKQYEKYSNKFNGKDSVVITWSDYIEDCIDLEMDLKSEHVLYPKDVHVAHQNTIKQIRITGNKLYDEKISKRVKTLEKYIFECDGLIIRPAVSSKELIDESSALNHCVATHYTKHYANGKTNIFLIRKTSQKDKPYFTLELKNGVIIQTHGKGNCTANEEVKEFIEKFKEEKLKAKIAIPA